MRLRHKPGIEKKLREFNHLVMPDNQSITSAYWSEVFPNENPIRVELGAGKGDFITTLARLHPDINYIAMERVPEVLYIAAKKWEIRDGLSNIKFLYADAEMMTHFFSVGQIDKIYLNFSDPWPKKRHARRRLTSEKFLEIYKSLLKKSGEIHFKTDNRDFFEFSLTSFAEAGFSLRKITFDLHNENYMKTSDSESIMTEYEKRFTALGQPICRCEAING